LVILEPEVTILQQEGGAGEEGYMIPVTKYKNTYT